MITVICWYIVITACSDSDYVPVTDTDMKHLRWYFSEECRRMPNLMYAQAILFSIGHMSWDTIRLFFFDKDWSGMDKQMVFHHFISTFGIGLPLLVGYGVPGIAVNMLLTENSSVFLVVRNLIPKSRKGSLPFMLNNYLFFATFTFFRIFLIPLPVFFAFQEMIALKPEIGFARFFILVPISFGIALYALNWFWYMKILRVLFQG